MMIYKKLSIAILIAAASAAAAANGVMNCAVSPDSTCITRSVLENLPPSFCQNVNGYWLKDADEAYAVFKFVYRDENRNCHTADSPAAIAAMGGGGGGTAGNKAPSNAWGAPGMTGGFEAGYNAMGQTSEGSLGSAGPGTPTGGGEGGGGSGGSGGSD